MWPMFEPAMTISKTLEPLSDQKLPHEILRIEDGTSLIVMDISGVDYGLTMIKLPNQRARPGTQ